jgi:hypothetical protein
MTQGFDVLFYWFIRRYLQAHWRLMPKPVLLRFSDGAVYPHIAHPTDD